MELPLTYKDIVKLLPHRYPFLLVDRITEYEPMKRIVGYKNVTANEEFFQGHFVGMGDAERAVAVFDHVGFKAVGRRLFGCPAGNFEYLAHMQMGGFQTVCRLYFLGGGAVTARDDPQRVAAPDHVAG